MICRRCKMVMKDELIKFGLHPNTIQSGEIEGTTIEKYFISQRIEKRKEFLQYDKLSRSEIANSLSYSSIAYLSNQFKKQAGLTQTFYKLHGQANRKSLYKI